MVAAAATIGGRSDSRASHAGVSRQTVRMTSQELAGLVLGILAIVLGIGLVFAGLRRRRMKHENAPTYQALGGPLYTVFQIGCASLMIIVGLIMVGAVAIVLIVH
jgi:hypothetical protein